MTFVLSSRNVTVAASSHWPQASSSSTLYQKGKLISHAHLPMQPRTAQRLFQDQANALQASDL